MARHRRLKRILLTIGLTAVFVVILAGWMLFCRQPPEEPSVVDLGRARHPGRASALVTRADGLYDKGGLANIKRSIPLYVNAVEQDPRSFEAAWKCARALRQYANTAKKQKAHDWNKTCARFGKKAMRYATHAIRLDGSKPHGHQWYGLAVGSYADGVSIVTALSEGLKDKTQTSFEKAYRLDKMYNNGAPMIALGRFWSVLPWPLKDREKGLKHLREFQEHFPSVVEGQIYLAEVLVDMGGEERRAEAKTLLQQAVKTKVPFWRDRAKALLKDL